MQSNRLSGLLDSSNRITSFPFLQKLALVGALTFLSTSDSPKSSTTEKQPVPSIFLSKDMKVFYEIPKTHQDTSVFQTAQITQNISGTQTMDKCVLLDMEIKSLIEKGEYEKALTLSFQRETELQNAASYDTLEFINLYTNMCMIYAYMKRYSQASHYVNKALSIAQKAQYYRGIVANLNTIYQIFFDQKKYDIALGYLEQVISLTKNIDLQKQTELTFVMGVTYGNFVECYLHLGNIEKAQEYFTKTEIVFEEIKLDEDETWILYLKGKILSAQGRYQEALKSFDSSLDIAKKINYTEYQQQILNEMDIAYFAIGDYEKAHECLKLSDSIKQLILNKEVLDNSIRRGAEHKQLQNERLQSDNEKKQIILEKNRIEIRNKNLINWGSVAVSLLVAGFLYGALKAKRKLQEKNTIISSQNDELQSANELITEQKEELQATNEELESTIEELDQVNQKLEETNQIITQKNQDITSSINYSKTIQNSMLSAGCELSQLFPESFLLSKPKDIVGGDFYFSGYSKNNQKVLAVADCTGHGVPGAFLTIYSHDKLKDLIQRCSTPAEVLDRLDTIFENLQQSQGTQNKPITDAMDIVLCYIDEEKNILNYAGSGRPLWIVRNGEILVYDAPMGKTLGTPGPQSFSGYTTQQISLEDGDQVYLFSDGINDQFGGEFGKKLGQNGLKKVVKQAQNFSIEEQYVRISAFLEKWTNDPVGGHQDQVDDIMLLGMKYKSCSSAQKSIDFPT